MKLPIIQDVMETPGPTWPLTPVVFGRLCVTIIAENYGFY